MRGWKLLRCKRVSLPHSAGPQSLLYFHRGAALGRAMRRRDFIKVIAGSAAPWPLVARAQQPTTPLIGFLHPGSPEANTSPLAAFRKGLGEAGYTDGRNVAIEFRWAHGDNSRL